jgi:hypothetical protein
MKNTPSDMQLEEWLPLVRKIARKLQSKLPPSVEIDDLIQWRQSNLRRLHQPMAKALRTGLAANAAAAGGFQYSGGTSTAVH